MPKFVDLSGRKCGAWTVISRSESPRSKWLCRCECGVAREVLAQYLKSGHSKSCGCRNANRKHGAAAKGAPEDLKATFNTWSALFERCLNPKNPRYKNYGARGIYICERWKKGFSYFLEDMGIRPPGKSIDRIDNNGPYSPTNCRWSTPIEQSRNTTKNVVVEFNGKKQCIRAWEEETGIAGNTIRFRLKSGIPFGIAISAKKLPRKYFKGDFPK